MGIKRGELMLSTKFEAPNDAVSCALADIWVRVLNMDLVGLDDDFFEIGGDSLAAALIAGEIEMRFGCKFSPSHIIDTSTIAAQAAYIHTQADAVRETPANLTVFHEGGKKPPLFLIHGGAGYTLYSNLFLDGFDKDRPVIFIEAVGLDGKNPPLNTVEEMAEHYLCSIRQMAPQGNWILAANCAGALISIEICKQAQLAGECVDRLLFVDPLATLFKKTWCMRFSRWFKNATYELLPAWVHHLRTKVRTKRRGSLVARVGEGQSSLVASKIPYNAQAMYEVTETLRKATGIYTPSKWDGLAFFLVTDERKSGLPVFKTYLPKARFRIVNYDHQALFDDGLPEVIKFLEDGISCDDKLPF